MIRVILKGGLGNQMFQYALGKSLALKYDVPLKLDLSFLKFRLPFKRLTPLKGFTYRDYDLDLFGIKDRVETIFNNDPLDKYFSYPLIFFHSKFFERSYLAEGTDPYKFQPKVLESGPEVTLEGFWNNYRYFEGYKKEIVNIFDTEKLFDPKYGRFEEEIKDRKNSVSIHIRRGDYLNDKHRHVYITLSDFYKRAVDYLMDKLEDPYFYIFSESNPEWLGSLIKLDKNQYRIVGKELSGYKNRSHFRSMSLCHHNIISNSTFSWWAAYLNKNKNKIVVSPKKWMYKYEFDNVKSWVAIEP